MYPLSSKAAAEVYDILVRLCGASDHEDSFLQFEHYVTTRPMEYRFQGRLGFGGKFHVDHHEWRVGCYPEDMNPERRRMIDQANSSLMELKTRYSLDH